MVYGHLDDPEGQDLQRGVSYLKLRPGVCVCVVCVVTVASMQVGAGRGGWVAALAEVSASWGL